MRIVEVGPRDGLQNESTPIATELKLAFIRSLADAGLSDIEATSFVSPKWVPQLADARELWPQLPPGPTYSALVPNRRGLATALEVGCQRIALFTAASDAFTQKNVNMTVDQTLVEFAEVIAEFRAAQPKGWIRGYVSTAYECPYAGRVDPKATIDVSKRLLELGVDEISLGDTIGVASPKEVKALARQLLDVAPQERLAHHFHDTRGLALANVAACYELGFTIFDSSAAGLGGCPYAVGAGGNLATEDLVAFFEREGVATGVDLSALAQASLPILAVLGRAPAAKAQQAVLAELRQKSVAPQAEA